MPTHVRTQIRHLVRNTLAAQLNPNDYVIYTSRRNSKNVTGGVAVIDIRCSNDQVRDEEVQYTDGPVDIRVASIYIRLARTGYGDTLDDQLDADEVLINGHIMDADWSSLCEEPPKPVQFNFASDGSGEQDYVEIVMRYDFEYRVLRSDPTTPVP